MLKRSAAQMRRERIVIWGVVLIPVIGIVAGVASSFSRSLRNTSCAMSCVNNLRMIESGKEQWALANHKTNGDAVVGAEVNEYIKGNTTPTCPQGGAYRYNAIGADPECSGVTKLKDGRIVPHRFEASR